MREKCDECGGKLIEKKLPYRVHGEFISNFLAVVCTKCGEICYSGDTISEMTKILKKKGLWGLESTTKIQKVGDSFGVIINKKIAEYLNLKKGESVRIRPSGKNKIIIEV